jgi:hypothetical protein
LIIIIILVVAFGPIAYFVPSRRDRQLTSLRARARQEGLTVDIRPLQRMDPTADERVSAAGRARETTRLTPRYALTLRRRPRALSSWRLLRGPATRPAIEIGSGWFYDPVLSYPPEHGWVEALAAVRPYLQDLPQSIRGVELEGQEMAVYWIEPVDSGPEDVSAVAEKLRQIGESLLLSDEKVRGLAEPPPP